MKEFYDRGGALHVAGPQRQQPARRFEYRRSAGLPLQQRTLAAGPGSHRRDESPGHDGGSVASLERRQHGSHAAFQGSGDCVAFRRARARRRQPEYGRRAVAGAEEERRRDSGGGLRIVRQDGFEGTHRCPGEVARRVRACAPGRTRRRRRTAAGADAAERGSDRRMSGRESRTAATRKGRGARRTRRGTSVWTRFRPRSARNTTSGWPRSTRSSRPRPAPT